MFFPFTALACLISIIEPALFSSTVSQSVSHEIHKPSYKISKCHSPLHARKKIKQPREGFYIYIGSNTAFPDILNIKQYLEWEI